MTKRLIMLLTAVAGIAVAVPASAGANTPTLFDHAGKVAIGAKFLATSGNFRVTTSPGEVKCAKMTITGQITHNSGGTARGVGEGMGTSSTCTVGGNPITVTDITLHEFHTAAAGTGTINITLKADMPGGFECHFASAGVPFTYTVGVTNDIITIINGNLVGTPPVCEPGTLNADFTLETELPTGTGVIWFQ